jgi:hypothetical protein
MTELEQIWYDRGRQAAIDFNGEDQLLDDGTLEHIFPEVFLKAYRETLLAIQLVKQHGIDKVFGKVNA